MIRKIMMKIMDFLILIKNIYSFYLVLNYFLKKKVLKNINYFKH